ncbi:hypothetical protein RTF48_24825, partial [Escherichia coli]|uniref:hypothetical protein n=1 Tax=Escherichia coli TaxID=562 RepID=UPI0028E399EA
VSNGTVQLQGAPVLHANKLYLTDWDRSHFIFSDIEVTEGKTLKVGLHADVITNRLSAARNSRIVLGHHGNDVLLDSSQAWKHVQKCYM